MLKFDHLALPVISWIRSRDWYVQCLGMKVEFEIPQRCTAALQDEQGFTIFVQQSDATHRTLSAAGVVFPHPPQRVFWGYGAELFDPDGYLVRFWDERSMNEKGNP